MSLNLLNAENSLNIKIPQAYIPHNRTSQTLPLYEVQSHTFNLPLFRLVVEFTVYLVFPFPPLQRGLCSIPQRVKG